MAERTRDTWSGVLVPEVLQVTVSTGDTAGLHVGPAVPDESNSGQLVLRTLRTERSSSSTVGAVELRPTRPGAPAAAGRALELGATVGSGDLCGWIDPSVSWGTAYNTSGTDIWRLSPTGGIGVREVLTHDDLSLGWDTDPHDLCPHDDDQILAVRIVATQETHVIEATCYRLESGVPDRRWLTRQSVATTDLSVTSDVVREVRVAYVDGQAVLLCTSRSSSVDQMLQWASDDGGASWQLVGRSSDIAAASCGDVHATHMGLVAVWASQDSDGELRVARMGSVWEPLWTSAYVEIASSLWNAATADQINGLRIAVVDAETELWIVGLSYSAAGDYAGLAYVSMDGGTTWRRCNNVATSGEWLQLDSTITRPGRFDAAWAGLCGVATMALEGATYRTRLGGWSAVGPTTPTYYGDGTAPRGDLDGATAARTVGWAYQWACMGVSPSTTGWTASGTATETMADSALTISDGGGIRASKLYTTTTGNGVATVHRVAVRWTATADGPQVNSLAPVVVDCILSDGTASWGVRVAIGDDTVTVYEWTGAGSVAAIGSAVSHTRGADRAEWYLVLEYDETAAEATIYLASRDASGAQDLVHLDEWDVHYDSVTSTLTDVSAVWSTGTLRWGGNVSAGEASIWVGLDATSVRDGVGFPAQLGGRPWSGPAIASAPPDLVVEAIGGVPHEDDRWTVEVAADGSGDHLVDLDPLTRWRAPAQLAATITATHDPVFGPTYGVALRGLQAEGVTLELRDASTGSWQAVTIARAVTGLQAARVGDTLLYPSAGSSTDVRLRQGELDGAYVAYDGVVAEVEHTEQGRWATGSGIRRAWLRAEVGSGTTSPGALTVYPTDLCVLVQVGSSPIDGVRLTLAAGAATWPSGSTWCATHLRAGRVIVWADDVDWVGIEVTEQPVDLGEGPDGRLRPRALAPAMRRVDLSWSDGISELGASLDDDDADYVAAYAGGTPVSEVGGTAQLVHGLYRQLQGPVGDLVVLPRVDADALTSTAWSSVTLWHRHDMIHGRVVDSQVRREAVLGDPGRDQVVRVPTVSVLEIA